jgi:hypothetical protein
MQFIPSRRTVVHLCLAWLVAAVLCGWFLAPRLVCEARPLSCEELLWLALASSVYGLAFAALYVALVVLLDPVVQLVRPQARALEREAKVLPVVASLFALQAVALGVMAALGALPAEWPWWLGALGAFRS